LYCFLRPYKLGTLSMLLAVASLSTLLVVPSYQLGKYLWESRRTANVSKLRLSITLTVLAIVAALAFFVPVPWGVRASFTVRPQRPQYVWPELPGVLTEQYVEDGDRVKRDQPLALLRNPQREQDQLELDRQREQHLILTAVYTIAQDERRYAMQMEHDLAKQTEEQVKVLKAELETLTLRAPRDGVVMQPPKPAELGTYFDIGAGRPFCMVADPTQLEALLVIDQTDKDLVHEGQKVKLKLYSHALDTIEATVHIPNVSVDQLPPELSNAAGGEVATKPDDETGVQRPLHTQYYAIVTLPNPDLLYQPGMRGIAKIDADRIPVALRIWRWLKRTFHFEA
jgi:putative peptide zinc metalloprotease protein